MSQVIVTKLPINDIKPNPNNPRLIRDEQYKKLVQSLKDLPEMAEVREIVINKENIILGGNMRYRAMKDAGWSEAPVKIVDWSEEKQRQFIIKDNVAGGDWDWDMLVNEWDTELLKDWGLDLIDYHTVNDVDPESFEEFNEIIADDTKYKLIISFDDENILNEFMRANKIILDNNYKRVGKAISINYPLETRRDTKNIRFE